MIINVFWGVNFGSKPLLTFFTFFCIDTLHLLLVAAETSPASIDALLQPYFDKLLSQLATRTSTSAPASDAVWVMMQYLCIIYTNTLYPLSREREGVSFHTNAHTHKQARTCTHTDPQCVKRRQRRKRQAVGRTYIHTLFLTDAMA